MKTQRFLVGCLFLISFSACKHHAKPESPLIGLVNKRFAAMNKHDVESIAKMYADSAIIQSPNMEKYAMGPDGIRSAYKRYFATSPDMVYRISRILPGDSSVTVEYTFGGTMQQLEKDVPQYMLGKYYKLKSCTILEVRNQKIVADITYFDQLAFLQQVGFFEKH